jgi:hypothetical protein
MSHPPLYARTDEEGAMTTAVKDVRLGETKTPYVRAADGALRAGGLWEDDVDMLLGLTGLGFHIVVDPKTCPSSPTSYDWTHVHTGAMNRIGVSSRCVEATDAARFDRARGEAVALVKASLDRGVPAVFRTFEYAEFGVLTGYDEEDGVFHVSDMTGSADPVLFANLGRPHGYPALFVQVFGEREGFDLERAGSESFRYAIDCWHGHGWPTGKGYGYKVGEKGYEALMAALEGADTDPLGLRYILLILADARVGIASYMTKLTGSLPGLAAAADLYREIATRLTRASELLPAQAPWERPLEKSVLPEATKCVREAAALEAKAIAELADR